jgi:hypothetical protein
MSSSPFLVGCHVMLLTGARCIKTPAAEWVSKSQSQTVDGVESSRVAIHLPEQSNASEEMPILGRGGDFEDGGAEGGEVG